MEDWKIKIAVLWLFGEGAAVAGAILGIFEPDMLKEFVTTGEIEGMKVGHELLLILAIALLVPLVMAFLSLALKNSVNRWVNIIVGIVWTVLGLTDLPTYLAKPTAYAILMWLAGLAATALVVWYAWKSK